MNTTEKWIMLLFFAPDYGSLSVHLLLNTKLEKHVEVVWTACCHSAHSQERCALCDLTGWLRRAQSREQSCRFFLVFWRCWVPWILSLWNVKKHYFWNVKNNFAASQYKSHFKADSYCNSTEQNKLLQSCRFSSFMYFLQVSRCFMLKLILSL